MNTYTLALIGLLVIVLIIVSPFLSIWALNILFSLTIPMNIWTWLAVCWLHIVIGGSVSYKKS
jgi:hypothetical protein